MTTTSSLSLTTGFTSPYLPANQKNPGSFLAGSNSGGSARVAGNASVGHRTREISESSFSTGEDTSASDASATEPVSYNSEASSDYRTLVKDLVSGTVSAAQKDNAKLQSDLKLDHAQGQSDYQTPSSDATVSTASVSSGSVIDVTV
jgi:hypothetical protein